MSTGCGSRFAVTDIARDHFIAHFSITIGVQCLRLWPKRSKSPPYHIATSLHEWINIASGHVALKVHEFHELVEPVIDDLHRRTPTGMRPCSHDVAGSVYDALSAAGVEVTIRPPVAAHSPPR